MDRGVRNIFYMLLLLNFAIVLFLSFSIFSTINKICDDGQARNFLEFARYLPHVGWKVPVYSIVLFCLLGILTLLLMRRPPDSNGGVVGMYLVIIALSCGITYFLNFSYKGLFLLAAAGAFLYMPKFTSRMAAIAGTLVFFVLFDYDLLTVRLTMVSYQDFIQHHDPQAQITLYGVKSLLESVHLILLVIFFYFLVQSKIQENREFIDLNNQLADRLFDLEVANGKLEEAGKMKERNRLAHDIHDIIGHSLTSVSTGLEACMEVMDDGNAGLRNHLVKIKGITDKGLLDIRRSVGELKIDAIRKYSLHIAIKELIDDINSIGRYKSRLSISGNPVPLQSDEEQIVYRVVQESITNSMKYSEARHIIVELNYGQGYLNLRISDDGRGCRSIRRNFGLSHIEEQLSTLGGRVEFITGLNLGFKTIAEVPLRSEAYADKRSDRR